MESIIISKVNLLPSPCIGYIAEVEAKSAIEMPNWAAWLPPREFNKQDANKFVELVTALRLYQWGMVTPGMIVFFSPKASFEYIRQSYLSQKEDYQAEDPAYTFDQTQVDKFNELFNLYETILIFKILI